MSVCDAPGLLPLQEAIEKQLAQISPVCDLEDIAINQALGRTLAKDIVAPINVPPVANSAMDGYALKAADSDKKLNIVGESLAGHPFTGVVNEGEAIRIMTGAPIPTGADTVVMQEETAVTENHLICNKTLNQGNNIRLAGEDIASGSIVVSAGQTLAAQHLSLIASIGLSEVAVYRKLKVAVIATGDELVNPGLPLQEGQIYESNRIGIISILQKLNCEILDMGIVPDNLEQTRTAFKKAASNCDWIISSGGVSVGDADFVKQVLEEQGKIDFWKVAIKPGKPYAFGKIGKAWFSGLPGNPVSSFVTLLQLVVPCLNKLAGKTTKQPAYLRAKLDKDIRRRAGRTEFMRARAWLDQQGELRVEAQPKQGSGIMNSFTQANCFLLLDADCNQLTAGSAARIQLFDELLK